MALRDDQVNLLQTAVTTLHSWQTAAVGAGVLIQQVTLEFPPEEQTSLVQFTWDADEQKFNIATLNGASL